jgi:hypothetical protein
MKEHAIAFSNFISNNFRPKGLRYKYAGDFYNNGPFLTVEEVYAKFEHVLADIEKESKEKE